MQRSSQVSSALLGVCLLVGSATAAWAQDAAAPATADMTQRMQELEKQVAELRAALASMKTPPPAEAPAAAAPAAAAATPAPAAPTPITITSLLGSTTLSGFVDGYYGANFNHPASHTKGVRNLDIMTQHFGLKMIEIVVYKEPEANANPFRNHVSLR